MKAPLALSALLPLASCVDHAAVVCDCEDPAVHVIVPPGRAGDVVALTFSGRACPGAVATCVSPGPAGCEEYAFDASAVGECDLEVTFTTAPHDFQAAMSFTQFACCPGYYVEPSTASPIELPAAASDAGVVE
jgi:hypothetical protein